MAKVYCLENPIPWICNDEEEDFHAATDDYYLRIEQLGKNSWWWSVSYNGEQIIIPVPDTQSCLKNAIKMAEGVYYGHRAAMKHQEETFIHKIRNIYPCQQNKMYQKQLL